MTRDGRLDVLQDALIEGRDDVALRLIAEIADEVPGPTPLERLRALHRDIYRETGQPVEFEVGISDDNAVSMLDHLQPGIAERMLRSTDPQSHRRITLADGITVFASEHLRRRRGFPGASYAARIARREIEAYAERRALEAATVPPPTDR